MVAGETGLALEQQEIENTVNTLRQWTRSQLTSCSLAAHSLAVDNWQALGGDAGFRRYFRLHQTPLLAVWAPPATEKNREFVAIAEFLINAGLRAPRVFAFDSALGFLLIEDLGQQLYFDLLNGENADSLYNRAFDTLLQLHQAPVDSALFSPYSDSELNRELNLFPQWFLERMLGVVPPAAEQALLTEAFQLLCDNAHAQPRVVVLRDFHSRNLIACDQNPPGVIDFQDGVAGPVTYDLVSLLRDCYVEWPDDRVDAWVEVFRQKAVVAGRLTDVTPEAFRRWFDLMGLQRHLKVLGIFARLALRDGKTAYLNDLPLVIRYVRRVAGRYEQLGAFHRWFEAQVMPRVATQPWMTQTETVR